MRQYPIWVDIINNSYNSSKSYGIKDYAVQHVMIGTSSRNSFDFVKLELSVQEETGNNYKTYQLRVNDELIKQAVYNPKTKEMELEDVKTSNFAVSEKALKIKYFKKWKDEAEAKEQDFRNKRYAERLAVNG